MTYTLLTRPRTQVKIHRGEKSLIGKTLHGRVGVVTKRYGGPELKEGEVWLADVVYECEKYFIMLPTELIQEAASAT